MAQANTKKDAVAPKGSAAVALPNYDTQFQGAGWDNTTQEDFRIPFLNQLQALSPAVAEGKVDGAKPGMFLNGVTEKLYDGDVFLIPCLTKHNYVERTPESAGGKFVGEHALARDCVRGAEERGGKPRGPA